MELNEIRLNLNKAKEELEFWEMKLYIKRNQMDEVKSKNSEFLSLNTIIETLEELYGIELNSKSRIRVPYLYARYAYCRIAKTHTRLSLEQIGDEIDKGHATVLHALKVHDDLYELDKQYTTFVRPAFKIIEQKLKKNE